VPGRDRFAVDHPPRLAGRQNEAGRSGACRDPFGRLQKDARRGKDQGRKGPHAPTFHEIRSLAARLYADQYGAEFAQALLGHKSAEMTALYRDSRGKEWMEVRVSA